MASDEFNDSARKLSQAESLIVLARSGDIAGVKNLLDAGLSIETRDSQGNTPLMWAALRNQRKMVTFLLEAGANIEAQNDFGRTALIAAAEYGDAETMGLLLEKGSKPDVHTKVFPSGHSGGTVLMAATNSHDCAKVKVVLDHGASVDATDGQDNTALMIAAENGDVAVARSLLDRGANINACNNEGSTRLMIAAKHGQDDMVEMLIGRGADITATNNQGQTAKECAEALDFHEIAQSIQRVADIRVRLAAIHYREKRMGAIRDTALDGQRAMKERVAKHKKPRIGGA